jgi:hypothetical protein
MKKFKSFYQPLFTKSEQRDLAAAPLASAALLEDEINMARVAIRRMFKISKEQAEQDPAAAVRTLAILSAVSGRLASLIRAQEQLKAAGRDSDDSDLRVMLESVLVEVQATWPKL